MSEHTDHESPNILQYTVTALILLPVHSISQTNSETFL
uniref:Uncharacterized protein n=1 Tax=Anguilla anguilla TaxID=7936 RepID=A0A0E9QRV2_ANGAN